MSCNLIFRTDGSNMKKNDKLPPGDHIVRYVSPARLRRDADSNVIGILGEAFQLRPAENSLSNTWLEYFEGSRNGQISSAVRAFRASLDVKKNSGFAIGNVDSIGAECSTRGHKIRIVYEPVDTNKAHCAVRRFPRDDTELLALLASGAWSELHLNTAFPPGEETAPDKPAKSRQ